MNQQQSQARMQSSVHTFTSMCWDKCVCRFSLSRNILTLCARCITSTPSTSFSRSEQGCLANCVDRFLDTSLFMVRKIEQERMNAGVSMSS